MWVTLTKPCSKLAGPRPHRFALWLDSQMTRFCSLLGLFRYDMSYPFIVDVYLHIAPTMWTHGVTLASKNKAIHVPHELSLVRERVPTPPAHESVAAKALDRINIVMSYRTSRGMWREMLVDRSQELRRRSRYIRARGE